MAEDLDYVPMPDKVVAAIQKVWAAEIKDADGKPLFTRVATDRRRELRRKAPLDGAFSALRRRAIENMACAAAAATA